ncbi:MAG: hypothetical protein KGH79_05105 [Patescibacteria group bacterium]|nr:hypothetical protein [Patescibacteria group bacterium]
MQNNYVWLGIGIIIAIVLVGGILFLRPHAAVAPTQSTTATTTTASTTSVYLGNGVTANLPPGATIKIVGGVNPPSLAGSINIATDLPADAQAALRTQEQTLIGELQKDPTRADLWLQLGVDRKIGADYQGAIAAWTYVAQAGPASINYVAYGDLGDLYMNFVKDYPKAAANYKAAIAINPTVIDYYRSLYNLYRYDDNNLAAAAAIVAQGLKANPNNPDLLQMQQQLSGSTQ